MNFFLLYRFPADKNPAAPTLRRLFAGSGTGFGWQNNVSFALFYAKPPATEVRLPVAEEKCPAVACSHFFPGIIFF